MRRRDKLGEWKLFYREMGDMTVQVGKRADQSFVLTADAMDLKSGRHVTLPVVLYTVFGHRR